MRAVLSTVIAWAPPVALPASITAKDTGFVNNLLYHRVRTKDCWVSGTLAAGAARQADNPRRRPAQPL